MTGICSLSSVTLPPTRRATGENDDKIKDERLYELSTGVSSPCGRPAARDTVTRQGPKAFAVRVACQNPGSWSSAPTKGRGRRVRLHPGITYCKCRCRSLLLLLLLLLTLLCLFLLSPNPTRFLVTVCSFWRDQKSIFPVSSKSLFNPVQDVPLCDSSGWGSFRVYCILDGVFLPC
jgi:hypothetical protein